MEVLTIRFVDVAKFNTQTPLSLLILCKLSFSIGGIFSTYFGTAIFSYGIREFPKYMF
jgi:hypothetical protein